MFCFVCAPKKKYFFYFKFHFRFIPEWRHFYFIFFVGKCIILCKIFFWLKRKTNYYSNHKKTIIIQTSFQNINYIFLFYTIHIVYMEHLVPKQLYHQLLNCLHFFRFYQQFQNFHDLFEREEKKVYSIYKIFISKNIELPMTIGFFKIKSPIFPFFQLLSKIYNIIKRSLQNLNRIMINCILFNIWSTNTNSFHWNSNLVKSIKKIFEILKRGIKNNIKSKTKQKLKQEKTKYILKKISAGR